MASEKNPALKKGKADHPGIADKIDVVEGEECPVCHEKQCTLTEMEKTIPFGERELPIYVFSMRCNACKYHKADVEFGEQQEPVKYTFEISSEADLNVRIVKSGDATVKIPNIMTIDGGPNSNGYISNVEGLLKRVKHAIEMARDSSEDDEGKRKAKNLLKKMIKIMWGQEKQKIIIEDPTGNSVIISDRAVKEKLRVK